MRCAPGEEFLDEEARRLLWRCRRGMKELDVLLERYVRSWLSDASSEERQALTQLLELPDPILSDYLFGYAAAPEPPLARLVAAIRGWTPVHAGMGAGRANVGPGRAARGSESPTWDPAPPAWDNIRESPEL